MLALSASLLDVLYHRTNHVIRVAPTSCDFKAKERFDDALAKLEEAAAVSKTTKEAADYVPCPENFVQVVGFGSITMYVAYVFASSGSLRPCLCYWRVSLTALPSH